jgi:hypothetical protein
VGAESSAVVLTVFVGAGLPVAVDAEVFAAAPTAGDDIADTNILL